MPLAPLTIHLNPTVLGPQCLLTMVLTRSITKKVLRSSTKFKPQKSPSQLRWELRRASVLEKRARVSGPAGLLSFSACLHAHLSPVSLLKSPTRRSVAPEDPALENPGPENPVPAVNPIHEWMNPGGGSDSEDSLLSSDSSTDALLDLRINFGQAS